MPRIVTENWIPLLVGILGAALSGMMAAGIAYGVITTRLDAQADRDAEDRQKIGEIYAMVVELQSEMWTQQDQAEYDKARREQCSQTLDRIHGKLEKIEEKTIDIMTDHARLIK